MKIINLMFFLLFLGSSTLNAQNVIKNPNSLLQEINKRITVTIICPANSPANVKLAAREVRRYLYLRTGTLLPIAKFATGDIVSFRIDNTLEEQQFRLKSDGKSLIILGGSDVAVLYGAYAFAEKLGVRFQIDGDVIPDTKIAFALPKLDETHKPLFRLRGLQPFHDFPEGPDWWTADDWKVISGQVAKMRMNFIGLHTYPVKNKDLGPEPTVWIGLPEDVNADGTVKIAGKTSWYTTAKFSPYGCYAPGKTSVFSFGASQLFPADDYGPAINRPDDFPFPKTPEACMSMANRSGQMLNDVFTDARGLGIKTAVGTESPLDIPDVIAAQLKSRGLNPDDPSTLQKLYEGMFLRIKNAYPVDYYWIWGHEGEIDEKLFITNIECARAALKTLKAPFSLGICGWGWTAGHFPSLDKALPKDVFFSSINHNVGNAPVSPNFAELEGRLKFAIPWAEDDGNMTAIQLLAGRMRRDAADAQAYGCDGLFCLHWRTRVISPNVSALAQAGWEISDWGRSSAITSKGTKGVTVIGGQTASYLNNQIAGTLMAPLYQVVRFGLSGYRFQVPNGKYKVTLHFCELAYKDPGKRIFDVKLQQKTVISDLDIAAKVGQFAALIIPFEDVEARGGELAVDFSAKTEFPCISAIEITGPGFNKKINCGGNAYEDFEADATTDKLSRNLASDDFYSDFAFTQFGPEVAKETAAIFTKLDGNYPRPTAWIRGPGVIKINSQPWSQVKNQYAFAEEMEALRPLVHGAGNLARFDWWNHEFQFMKSMAKFACARGELDIAITRIEQIKDITAQRDSAINDALPIRLKMTKLLETMYEHLLATLNNASELGTIANIELQSLLRCKLLTARDETLEKLTGMPLPAKAKPGKEYSGAPLLVNLIVRTAQKRGETLHLKIIALDKLPVKSVMIKVRSLGNNNWKTIPAKHITRAVWNATLPAAADDFEYQVVSITSNGTKLTWPATAPEINQTVVIREYFH